MQNQDTLLLSFFGLGIFFQVINLFKDPKKLRILALCAVFAALAFLPGKREHAYNINIHILSYFLYFSIAYGLVFMKDVLPAINEKIILIFTMIFWYLYVSRYGIDQVFKNPFLLFSLLPSVGVLLNAFTNFKLGFTVKLLLYIWFLIMVVCISYVVVFKDLFASLFLLYKLPPLSALDAFFYGGASFYMITNVYYLLYLIPIPGKHQTWSVRIKYWKEFIGLLVSKYDNYQLEMWQSFFLILFFCTLFISNSLYRYMPEGLMINMAILLVSLSPRIESLWVKHHEKR